MHFNTMRKIHLEISPDAPPIFVRTGTCTTGGQLLTYEAHSLPIRWAQNSQVVGFERESEDLQDLANQGTVLGLRRRSGPQAEDRGAHR